MITEKIRLFAIQTILSTAKNADMLTFMMVGLCMIALGITGKEIRDAVDLNPDELYNNGNPFGPMIEHAEKDPDICTTGINTNSLN